MGDNLIGLQQYNIKKPGDLQWNYTGYVPTQSSQPKRKTQHYESKTGARFSKTNASSTMGRNAERARENYRDSNPYYEFLTPQQQRNWILGQSSRRQFDAWYDQYLGGDEKYNDIEMKWLAEYLAFSESSWNPGVKNKKSSASGLFGIMPENWGKRNPTKVEDQFLRFRELMNMNDVSIANLLNSSRLRNNSAAMARLNNGHDANSLRAIAWLSGVGGLSAHLLKGENRSDRNNGGGTDQLTYAKAIVNSNLARGGKQPQEQYNADLSQLTQQPQQQKRYSPPLEFDFADYQSQEYDQNYPTQTPFADYRGQEQPKVVDLSIPEIEAPDFNSIGAGFRSRRGLTDSYNYYQPDEDGNILTMPSMLDSYVQEILNTPSADYLGVFSNPTKIRQLMQQEDELASLQQLQAGSNGTKALGGRMLSYGGTENPLPKLGDTWTDSESGRVGKVVDFSEEEEYMDSDGNLIKYRAPIVQYEKGGARYVVTPQYTLKGATVTGHQKRPTEQLYYKGQPGGWMGRLLETADERAKTPIQVQATPGVATSYATAGQYIPKVDSTIGREVGQLAATLSAPWAIPAAMREGSSIVGSMIYHPEWWGKAAARTAASMLGGLGWDALNRGITGHSHGENMQDLINQVTGWKAPLWLTDMTNPGYFLEGPIYNGLTKGFTAATDHTLNTLYNNPQYRAWALSRALNKDIATNTPAWKSVPNLDFQGIKGTQYYMDLVNTYGQETADRFIAEMGTPEFYNYFVGKDLGKATREIDRYARARKTIQQLNDAGASITGSSIIGDVGTIHRDSLFHDIDSSAYARGANHQWVNPNDEEAIAKAIKDLTTEDIEQSATIKALQDGSKQGAKVIEYPTIPNYLWGPHRIFQRLLNKGTRAYYRMTDPEMQNFYAWPWYTNIDGSVNRTVQTQMNGMPVDIFFTKGNISQGVRDGTQSIEAPFYAKRKWMRPKDKADIEAFEPYSENNMMLNPDTGQTQYAPLYFGNTLVTPEGYPAIQMIETYPGSGIRVPVTMNWQGKYKILGSQPKIKAEETAPSLTSTTKDAGTIQPEYTLWDTYGELEKQKEFKNILGNSDFRGENVDIIGQLTPDDWDLNFLIPYRMQNIKSRLPNSEGQLIIDNLKEGTQYRNGWDLIEERMKQPAKIYVTNDATKGVKGFHNVENGESFVGLTDYTPLEIMKNTRRHEVAGHGTENEIEQLAGQEGMMDYYAMTDELANSGIKLQSQASLNPEEFRALMIQAQDNLMQGFRNNKLAFTGDRITQKDIDTYQKGVNMLDTDLVAQAISDINSTYAADYSALLRQKPELLDKFKYLLSYGLAVGAPVGIGYTLQNNAPSNNSNAYAYGETLFGDGGTQYHSWDDITLSPEGNIMIDGNPYTIRALSRDQYPEGLVVTGHKKSPAETWMYHGAPINREGTLLQDIGYRLMTSEQKENKNLLDVMEQTFNSLRGLPNHPQYTGNLYWNGETSYPNLNRNLHHLSMYGNNGQFEPDTIKYGFDYSDYLNKTYPGLQVPTFKGSIYNTGDNFDLVSPTDYKDLVEYLAETNKGTYTHPEAGEDIPLFENYENREFGIDDTGSNRVGLFYDPEARQYKVRASDIIDYGGAGKTGYFGRWGTLAGIQGNLLSKHLTYPALILNQEIPIKFSNNEADYKEGNSLEPVLEQIVADHNILRKSNLPYADYEYPFLYGNLQVTPQGSSFDMTRRADIPLWNKYIQQQAIQQDYSNNPYSKKFTTGFSIR